MFRDAQPSMMPFATSSPRVIPPKMLMTRLEFRVWREELQGDGCKVELRFEPGAAYQQGHGVVSGGITVL